jgi:hypothetical protein
MLRSPNFVLGLIVRAARPETVKERADPRFQKPKRRPAKNLQRIDCATRHGAWATRPKEDLLLLVSTPCWCRQIIVKGCPQFDVVGGERLRQMLEWGRSTDRVGSMLLEGLVCQSCSRLYRRSYQVTVLPNLELNNHNVPSPQANGVGHRRGPLAAN